MSEYQSTKLRVRDRNSGGLVDLDFHIREYQEAGNAGLTLSQWLNLKHRDVVDLVKDGDVLVQSMMHMGMFTGTDARIGARPPNMREVFEGQTVNLAGITRPDGSNSLQPDGRLLFPEIIMRYVESHLRDNFDDFLGGWNGMIAQTTSIAGDKFEQPIINIDGPATSRAMPIGQLAEPAVMIGITTSNVTRKIPTNSIGLLISDQALQATTLDLVNLIVSAQARQERIVMVQRDINAIVEGDADRGETAKATYNASTLDSGASATQMTQKAWVKYLRRNYRRAKVTDVITDLNTAWILAGRSGKPTQPTNFAANSEGFNATMNVVDNLDSPSPRILIVDDGVVAAGKIVGLDRRYAMRRVINLYAAYSAIEEFVLRRGKAMRFDYGELTHTLYPDAFNVMVLA